MSDYSGPYDGRQHDPSEMRSGTDKRGKEERKEHRPEGEERSARTGRERPGDEGEEAGEGDRAPGAGPSVTGPPPATEGRSG
ncbi:hypothetical protein IQ279_02710 [Streptomyces verrucosisporus]|uniref:hypothetical protein n=1 Tax=Streptomyces verrucosisporus TaxID=1695161 RepID=UPI0019CFA3CB|nr:hypothetical protein [Streptomyces verrucosisporus]MBN3928567.1 hypothetical protein [Streptomyces verrucosisporus]